MTLAFLSRFVPLSSRTFDVMLRFSCLIVVIIVTFNSTHAQWDYYEAMWEGKPGSVLINMDWKQYAPVDDLPYLLETIDTIQSCSNGKMNDVTDLDRIEKRGEQVDSIVSLVTYLQNVGTMTHNCVVRNYYYINDSTGVTKALDNISLSTSAFRILSDPLWKGYLDFLYPDAYLMQTMVNAKTIKQLISAGDDPSKSRWINHFAGFTSEPDRNRYRIFLIEQGFRIEEESYDLEALYPYEMTFSRKDQVAVSWISDITLRLNRKASELNGVYNGWETEVSN